MNRETVYTKNKYHGTMRYYKYEYCGNVCFWSLKIRSNYRRISAKGGKTYCYTAPKNREKEIIITKEEYERAVALETVEL